MADEIKYQEFYFCFTCDKYMTLKSGEAHKLLTKDHKMDIYKTVPNLPKYQKGKAND